MSSLPPIDDRALPADVRGGTTADKNTYKSALAFERQLVAQLTQQLSDTSTDGDDGDAQDGADATSTSYRQMLPDVLADSVMQAGGLGLARQIAANLKERGA